MTTRYVRDEAMQASGVLIEAAGGLAEAARHLRQVAMGAAEPANPPIRPEVLVSLSLATKAACGFYERAVMEEARAPENSWRNDPAG